MNKQIKKQNDLIKEYRFYEKMLERSNCDTVNGMDRHDAILNVSNRIAKELKDMGCDIQKIDAEKRTKREKIENAVAKIALAPIDIVEWFINKISR